MLLLKIAPLAGGIQKALVDEGVARGPEEGVKVARGCVLVLARFATVGEIRYFTDDTNLRRDSIQFHGLSISAN